jgi:flagellar motility protein MotE (MotC chaperone)
VADLNRDLKAADVISVQGDVEKLVRLTNRLHLLNREGRRQLRMLLEQLDQGLGSVQDRDGHDARTIIASIRNAIQFDDEYLSHLVHAIVDCGLLKSQLDAAIQQQIDRRSQEIDNLAAQQARGASQILRQLEEEQHALTESIQRQKVESAKELHADRERFEQQIATVQQDLAQAHEDLRKREEAFEKHLQPVAERLASAQVDIVNHFLALSPLLKTAVNPQLADQPIGDQLCPANVYPSNSGESIKDWGAFINHRLWPVLREWAPTATRKQAELLHVCLLACRCSLVPNLSWAAAYAKAVGGQFTLRHVEPDWLGFSAVWTSQLERVWEAALADQKTLHLVMFSGVNRTPSPAWAMPLLSIAGGFSDSLPTAQSLTWPDNLRIIFDFDQGPASFTPCTDYVYAAGATSRRQIGNDDALPACPLDGYVVTDTWLSWSKPQVAGSADCLDLMDGDGPVDGLAWYRGRCADTRQLAKILISAGQNADSALRIAKAIRLEWPLEYLTPFNERD